MREIVYHSASVSAIGNRSANQDRCALIESINSMLLCLADGMGGHPKGEVAAQILVDTCAEMFTMARKPISNPAAFLTLIMRRAHEQIIAYGKAQRPAIKPRTTAVVALVQENTLYWVHAGDSRLYLFRDGEILARTTDHSYVELLRKQGAITASECESHPRRNYVTRCLGGHQQAIDFPQGIPTALLPGDILLLCSDGLWGALDDDALRRGMHAEPPLTERVADLVQQAEAATAPESDNITAIALQWIAGTPALPLQRLTESVAAAAEPHDRRPTLSQAVDALRDTIKSYKEPL